MVRVKRKRKVFIFRVEVGILVSPVLGSSPVLDMNSRQKMLSSDVTATTRSAVVHIDKSYKDEIID